MKDILSTSCIIVVALIMIIVIKNKYIYKEAYQ